MFTRLAVKDYQSVAEADIELAPFTVVVGRNRSGKTALLRALRALIFNQSGSGFIRRGQSSCEVEVDTAEGDTIGWKKTKTTAAYTLNDRTFSKMAGSVPEDIADALGVRAIEVDNSLTLTPQLARNTELLFLIDKSAGQIARALAKMTKLDIVVKAQALCRQGLKESKDKLKIAVAKRESAEQELREFPDMDAWGAEIEALRKKITVASAGASRHQEATSALQTIQRVEPDANVTLPDIGEFAEPLDLLSDLTRILTELKTEVPEDVGDIEPIKELANRWREGVIAEREREAAYWDVKEVDDEYEMKDQEQQRIQKMLADVKTCPVCGGSL